VKLAMPVLLGLALWVATSTHAFQWKPVAADDRQADRDAIRNHIDKTFQAYRNKDAVTIRTTHAAECSGHQARSETVVHGIDESVKGIDGLLNGPVRISGSKILEFGVLFYGTATPRWSLRLPMLRTPFPAARSCKSSASSRSTPS
jgi:hypothetical protein